MIQMLVVIDTNVLVAAQRSKRGTSSKLMSFIGTNQFDVVVSVPLITLIAKRFCSSIARKLALTPEDVADVVDAVCALAIPYKIYFLWRPYLRDRKDELVLELAVAARYNYVLIYNRRNLLSVRENITGSG